MDVLLSDYITVTVIHILGIPTGANEKNGDIPSYIKHSPAVWTLEKNSEGIPYNDELSLAAFQLNRRVNLAERT